MNEEGQRLLGSLRHVNGKGGRVHSFARVVRHVVALTISERRWARPAQGSQERWVMTPSGRKVRGREWQRSPSLIANQRAKVR